MQRKSEASPDEIRQEFVSSDNNWLQPLELSSYCSVRKELERNRWHLIARLSHATGRLLRLTNGQNVDAYLVTKAECVSLKRDVTESGERLRQHRLQHGC